MPERGGDRGGGHLGQGRGAVGDRETRPALRRGNRRGRAISAAPREERMLQKPRDMRLRSLPGQRQGAVEIGRPPGMAPHPIVDQRVARPGVEGENLVRSVADPGHVADPAEVQHRERLRQTGGQRGVVQRRQRRPLPAGGDIGAAEIADDIDPGQPRQQRAVADLPGAALAPGGAGSCGRGTRSASIATCGNRSRNRATASACSRVSSASTAAISSRGPAPPSTPRSLLAELGRVRERFRRSGNDFVARRRSRAPRHRCRRARCRSSAPPHAANLC